MSGYNAVLSDNLQSDFSSKNDAVFAWSNAVAALQVLPGLRGLWTMGAIDSSDNILDLSGGMERLDISGGVTMGFEHLFPYADFNGTTGYLYWIGNSLVVPVFAYQEEGTADTTTNASYEDTASKTLSITTAVSCNIYLRADFLGYVSNSAGQADYVITNAANTAKGYAGSTSSTSTINKVSTSGVDAAVAAGTITYKIRFRCSGGYTGTCDNCVFTAVAYPV